MHIIDITQPFSTRTAVWPGDRAVEMEWSLHHERGDSVNVAAITTSVHAGTHADGFLHVLHDGATIAEMPLSAYIGRCTVVDATGADVLRVEHVADTDLEHVERILFRTRRDVDPTQFPAPFAHVDPALAQLLADASVRLLGTDAPSVDPVDSKALPSHHILMGARVAIVENLLLTDVRPGSYTFVALPLRFTDADSSPVRAVLLQDVRLEAE